MPANFAKFLTPEEYLAIQVERGLKPEHLKELTNRSRQKGKCEVCETEHVWRLGNCGMCFTCTTGESDASDDYEIGEFYF